MNCEFLIFYLYIGDKKLKFQACNDKIIINLKEWWYQWVLQ